MNRIKFLREEKGVYQKDFAKLLAVTTPLINYYENEERAISAKTASILADYFNVSIDYLLGKSDTRKPESNVFPLSDEAVSIPVVGKISAGLPILAEENREGYEFAPSSLIKPGLTYFYLRVQGDSMNLKFNDGDIVLVQQQDDLENDEIGVVLVNGFDATVKKYKNENGLVVLYPMSTNPEHTVQVYNPKDIEIKIIGKVISYQGKV
jgi:repressor LexA